MVRPFVKMHGCGNDYIYFDCLREPLPNPEALSVRLSERHFGIGGDGIVLICPSHTADARMRMFNLDGSEGKMCGNAIRCVGKYLYESGAVPREEMSIETLSGIRRLHLATAGGEVSSVRVDMGRAELAAAHIPVDAAGFGVEPCEPVIGRPLQVGGREFAVTCVSMGNPHCVVFLEEDVDALDLARLGPLFEFHPLFPDRINTEFCNPLPGGEFKMRVWERGSGETLACGTGACASAVAACLTGRAEWGHDIKIRLRGGELTIHCTDEAVYMTGGATTVFKGEVEL
ncbi:diaminopimelate epimerase [Clostridiales bacterium BX7]|uniref:Diaminopimelate epimerase n=2 Tax=Feifania hominis TaxID=2763660 RepID=A0A926HQD6_9FIRM|nr:diaminopimelate epimerase [Feifania hominis]